MKSTEPVRVAVNIRPLLTSEGCTDCITVTPDEPQVYIGSHTFTYDLVFGNNGLPFSEIYHRCVAPLVEDLFKGYNATILAYGQTASGKSYTMGTNCGADGGGIIPKVMEDVFTRVEAVKSQIRISFLEIYNEEIYDLLAASKPSRTPIRIRETNSGEITLQGVTEVQVKTKEEMSSYLARGSSTRATGITNMNLQSSRSHAIFTISVKITTAEETLCAKICLVDLAGSERANRTGADGIRLKEGRHINSSLLALGNVIKILGGNERKKKKGVCHIPYRVSKLTRLLQDSLGGNSKTVMIACVSPAITDVEETLSTLRYANYARNIKNKAVVQKQKPSTPCFDAMVKELTPSNSDAKNKTVVQKHTPSSDYDAMVKELTPSPSKSESLPVYDKHVYDKEDVFQAFSELKIPWTSQAARFDDLFASTSSPSELRKPVYDKPMYDDDDVFEAISEIHYNEDVSEANHEIQYNEDVFEAISELQIPSTSQPDDVSSSPPSVLEKHNTASSDDSPKKTESEQEDKCQTKPVEIIDLTDNEAEVEKKFIIDLTTDEEAEVEEKTTIDLTTAESKEKLDLELKELNKRLEEKVKELNKRLEEKEAQIPGSYKEKVHELEKEKRALQREIEGLRQKLANRSSATPYCSCSKRSSCKTIRCQCLVANHFCLPSCGCSSIRCSNRSRERRDSCS